MSTHRLSTLPPRSNIVATHAVDGSISVGSPRFRDPELDALARAGQTATAWQRALVGDDVAAAVAGAHGDFAVALRRPDGSVVMAVDRFGIRTLCYRVVGSEIRCAERADELADTDDALDPQAIFDYLYFHVIPSPRTIFADVFRLPPGHCALFDKGRLQVLPYWTPAFTEPREVSFAALKDEFRARLRDAVAADLDGSRPACFLSGGTDSSTVAGLIAEVSGRPPATYSIGFDATGYDEMEYARIAARRYGTEHHEYYVTPEDLVQNVPTVAASFDQPFGNSSVLPAFSCATRAREDGITRLLAGDGGDELFGGNARYAMQRVFGWYRLAPPWLRTNALEPAFGQPVMRRIPLLKYGAGYVNHAKVPMPDRLQMHNLLRRMGMQEVLTPGFAARVDFEGPARHQREVWAQCGPTSELNRTLAFDWRYTLAESDLPKVRGATSLAGVSVGFPFLDQALLDFSLRLPTHYKLRGLKLRWFFKEALRGFLPDEIITKKKHGFGLPFGVWANRHEGLRRLAVDSVQGVAARGIIRPEFARQLIDVHLPAHPGYYGEMVWILMVLEQWMRRHAASYKVTP